jgi:hypothetical protein
MTAVPVMDCQLAYIMKASVLTSTLIAVNTMVAAQKPPSAPDHSSFGPALSIAPANAHSSSGGGAGGEAAAKPSNWDCAGTAGNSGAQYAIVHSSNENGALNLIWQPFELPRPRGGFFGLTGLENAETGDVRRTQVGTVYCSSE